MPRDMYGTCTVFVIMIQGSSRLKALFDPSPCALTARATTWQRWIVRSRSSGSLQPDLFAVMSADDDSTLSDTIINKLAPTTADGIPDPARLVERQVRRPPRRPPLLSLGYRSVSSDEMIDAADGSGYKLLEALRASAPRTPTPRTKGPREALVAAQYANSPR